jgi:peptide/nickel transport system permease protein
LSIEVFAAEPEERLTAVVVGRSPWLRFLAARAAGLVVTVCSLIMFTFLLVRLVPGDPARNIVGMNASNAAVVQVRDQLGLNDSIFRQFADYVGGLLSGDLGTSFALHQPVSELLAQRLPITAELAGAALVVVLIVAFPLGMLIAHIQFTGRARWASPTFSAGSGVAGAMPEYITGTALVFLFALTWQIFPAQGGGGVTGSVLPVASISLAPTFVLARLVRNETLSILSSDYIAAARSKRLTSRYLYLRHVLPNVVTSTLTLSGLLLVALLGGTLICENVFNIAGLGTSAIQSILASDYPMIQGTILTLGLLAVLINLLVDVVLGLLDARTLGGSTR